MHSKSYMYIYGDISYEMFCISLSLRSFHMAYNNCFLSCVFRQDCACLCKNYTVQVVVVFFLYLCSFFVFKMSVYSYYLVIITFADLHKYNIFVNIMVILYLKYYCSYCHSSVDLYESQTSWDYEKIHITCDKYFFEMTE